MKATVFGMACFAGGVIFAGIAVAMIVERAVNEMIRATEALEPRARYESVHDEDDSPF